jgi:aryl-alcohol dehydrogenase-like predicted oxidoreductase
MLTGFATAEATGRYRSRFPEADQAGHFRRHAKVPGAGELWISSIGLGTYLGDPSPQADAAYTEAVRLALTSGVNLLDTAINYRHQRSERNIGAALRDLVAAGKLQRDEVVVCTKAGYLSLDGDAPPSPGAYFRAEYVATGILDPAELAGGMHCMAPKYLADQIERSRRNLGLETIDVFYVHNPETQLGEVPRERFRQRLLQAFTMLEDTVRAGKIRYYGVATWNGFRRPPVAHDGMGLAETVDLARQAGSEQHHFRFVQLPFNLAMPEALVRPSQTINGRPVSMVQAARPLGIVLVTSASLLQGQLTRNLPPYIAAALGLKNDRERALQFARSVPGITTALVGMSQPDHVRANLAVAGVEPATREQLLKLFEQHR